MDTWVIVVIIVAVLILLAVGFLVPRMRRNAAAREHERELQARERELAERREAVAREQRAEAEERRNQAEQAELKAQMAATEAQRQRAEAELREQRAQLHERGMADDELIDETERDRFAGTSAMGETPTHGTQPGTTAPRVQRSVTEEQPIVQEPAGDYERGRTDERIEQQADPDDQVPPRRP